MQHVPTHRAPGRHARVLLAAVALAGCFGTEWPESPTAPTAPTGPAAPLPAPEASVFGRVINGDRECIAGATVRVVDGQAVSEAVTQDAPCYDWWGTDGGFDVRRLTAGVRVTLRVAAPGYVARDTTVVPGCCPEADVLIVLARE